MSVRDVKNYVFNRHCKSLNTISRVGTIVGLLLRHEMPKTAGRAACRLVPGVFRSGVKWDAFVEERRSVKHSHF